jgi:hypothetical protein
LWEVRNIETMSRNLPFARRKTGEHGGVVEANAVVGVICVERIGRGLTKPDDILGRQVEKLTD